jgi:hypothetical protein
LDSVEKLDKFVKDANARLEEHEQKLTALGDSDGEGRKALESQIKEMRGLVEESLRRHLPVAHEDGKTLIRPEDFKKLGIEAMHKAPTPVQRKESYHYAPSDEPLASFQDAADDLLMIKTLLHLDNEQVRTTKFYREEFVPKLQRAVKAVGAFDTADSTLGSSTWVPTGFSSRLIEKVRLELSVAALFEEFAMPRSPFMFPVWLTDLIAYKFAENTAVSGQTAITGTPVSTATPLGKVTFTGKGIGTHAITSKFFEEDSIVPVLPFLQRAIVQAIRNGIENCIINGDTTSTHQDYDTEQVATDVCRSWIGLRKHCIALGTTKVDASGATLDSTAEFVAYVLKGRGLMGTYGVNPQNVALIVSPNIFNQMLGIEAFATAASLSPGTGTNVQGQFGFTPFGMQLVVSEFMRSDMAATGVNTTGGPNTFTGAIVVNKNSWILGTLRNMTVQVCRETLALYDQDDVLVTWRGDFETPYGTSALHTAYVYDVGL